MISRLTGTIAHIDLKYAILDVNGVGYKVYTTSEVLGGLGKLAKAKNAGSPSEHVTLWTYLAVRDDALDLYGFTDGAELSFFEMLIGISGIGPKTALGILNIASTEAIDNAIRTGDTTHLVKVSGVSKKIAEKIVLELKDKIGDESLVGQTEEYAQTVKSSMKNDADALEALKALGYNPTEARDALKEIVKTAGKEGREIKDTGEKVKAALKLLSQQS
jgi:Holliday junction DNA helicase RuvA